MYIGKTKKCPICKQKGYLKLSGNNFQVQHQIKSIRISKGNYKVIYKYCTLQTIRNIIRDYERKFTRQFNEHNPNIKKALYDKKRRETQRRIPQKTAYYHPTKIIQKRKLRTNDNHHQSKSQDNKPYTNAQDTPTH
jgi:hypothetical protein